MTYETPTGANMFAYCMNNPVMCTDQGGSAPAWWQWTISGLMLVSGVALIATGVGGVAGGSLICAGENSIIGSYVSEASGGSSIAGWTGGMVTGALCGMGAGYASEFYAQATMAVNGACMANLAASGAYAFGFGFSGSLLGQDITAKMDEKVLDPRSAALSATTTGALNMWAAIGTGMGNAFAEMPKTSSTSYALANGMNAAISLLTEAVCDGMGMLSSIFS